MCNICGNPNLDFRYVSGEVPLYVRNEIERHRLRPGIQVNIRRHRAHGGLSETWEVRSRTVMLDFVVSGEYSCKFLGGRRIIEKSPGFSCISYFPGHTLRMVYKKEEKVRWLGILIDKPALLDLISDACAKGADPLRKVLETDRVAEPFFQKAPTAPVSCAIMNQIFDCPYKGSLGRLFRESKMLELLSTGLSIHLIGQGDASRTISRRDVDKLHYVRRMLSESFEETPTLFDLAKRVGMSETKLKRNFKEYFGIPVFRMYKQVRMETAREMLLSGEWNVTQAAVEVGYSSLSHFSQAFRKHFGISPKHIGKKGL